MPGKGRQFKRGNAGRPKGSKGNWTLLTDHLREALEAPTADDPDKTELDLIIAAMIREAKSGDVQAATFIADRVEGKTRPAEAISGELAPPGLEVARRLIIDEYNREGGDEVDLGISGLAPLKCARTGNVRAVGKDRAHGGNGPDG